MQQKRAKALLREVWAARPDALARIRALHPAIRPTCRRAATMWTPCCARILSPPALLA